MLQLEGAVHVLNHLNIQQNPEYYLKQPSESILKTMF